MKYLIWFSLLLLSISCNAQFSIYTETVEILDYDFDDSRYYANSHAAIGLSYQYDVHTHVFFESRLSSRFDRGDGLVWTNGFYFNRTPELKRFLFVTGIGIISDGYNDIYDYYVEARIRLNMGPLALEGSGSFNLKENLNIGPKPKGAIRLVYKLSCPKFICR